MLAAIEERKIKPQTASRVGNVSDEFLHAIVEACVSNVAVLDEAGVILYASKAWRRFELLNQLRVETPDAGLHFFERCRVFNEPEFDDAVNVSLADDLRAILGGNQKEFHREYVYQGLNEQSQFVMHAARLNLPGHSFRVLMTREDLPSTRDPLGESKERLSQLLDTTKIIAWEGEAEGARFTYVSDQAVKLLGYPIATWYEKDFLASHVHRDDKQRVLACYQNNGRSTQHFDLTFRMLACDNRVVWVQNLVSFAPEEGKPTRTHGLMIDISDRKQAEEALRDLGGRLINAQEEERRRVARELHDDLNQRMALLSIEIEQLGKELQEPLKARDRVRKLQSHVQEISTDIHRLSYRLHPSKLDHLGLVAAARSLCHELSESGQLQVSFHQHGVPATLPKDITLCLFRIAQESLRNCAKHSEAKSARVVLTKTNNAIRLSVSDEGRGFDTKSDLMKRGLGFISMRERLHILGGELEIFSKPQRGTRIEVSIPLKIETEADEQFPVNS
jgi:PAS domain S-box-containing protein